MQERHCPEWSTATIRKYSVSSFDIIMATCVADADIIFLPCDFFLSIFFIHRLISAASDWMPTILPHMLWP